MNIRVIGLALAAIFGFGSLAAASPGASGGAPKYKIQKNDAPRHIVLIGLDGWGGYSMPKADMPNVKRQMERGAWTMKKRSVLPSSSAINWAAMFMGLPTEGHGYLNWGSKKPELEPVVWSNSADSIPYTIFRILRNQKPGAEIGAFYEWDGIGYLVDTLALSTHRNIPLADNNSDKITEAAASYILSAKPMLTAVIYDNPDHVGHTSGHDTPDYYAILAYLDRQIGRIVEATKSAGIYDDTVFIITADHGGVKKGHGKATLPEMETPMIMAGPGVKKLGEMKSSLMQYDVAATIAALLGIEMPQCWVGRPASEALE